MLYELKAEGKKKRRYFHSQLIRQVSLGSISCSVGFGVDCSAHARGTRVYALERTVLNTLHNGERVRECSPRYLARGLGCASSISGTTSCICSFLCSASLLPRKMRCSRRSLSEATLTRIREFTMNCSSPKPPPS